MLDKIIHRWLRLPYTLHVTQYKKVKNPCARVLFIHGIGNSGEVWQRVIDKLPDDVSIMTIDLLGFGKSPHPEWAEYDVVTQARSIIATLLKLRLTKRVTIVGHSLGSLVAIEVTKRYPLLVKSLVLCSPPLYDAHTDKNRLLRRLFLAAKKRPDDFLRLASIATKYKLVNPSFSVNEGNIHSYMETLRASILMQTSLEDVKKINKPLTLIAGSADPFVKKRNLKSIAKTNKEVEIVNILAGHEIRGRYVQVVVDVIVRQADKLGSSS